MDIFIILHIEECISWQINGDFFVTYSAKFCIHIDNPVQFYAILLSLLHAQHCSKVQTKHASFTINTVIV